MPAFKIGDIVHRADAENHKAHLYKITEVDFSYEDNPYLMRNMKMNRTLGHQTGTIENNIVLASMDSIDRHNYSIDILELKKSQMSVILRQANLRSKLEGTLTNPYANVLVRHNPYKEAMHIEAKEFKNKLEADRLSRVLIELNLRNAINN